MTIWIEYTGYQTLRNGRVVKRKRRHEVTRELPPHARNVKIIGVHKYPSATLVDVSYESPQAYRGGVRHYRKRTQTIKIGKTAGKVKIVKK